MQFKPTHFFLGAFVVTALACTGGGSGSADLSAKQRSYTPINLTYDNTTVDIKINGLDILNSAGEPVGKNLTAWPAAPALVPSFRTTSPATPAGQVSYEIKKTGGSVLTLPTDKALHTQADRQLFVVSGTQSAIRGFYIPFLVPDDSNPTAVVSVTHLAAPTLAGFSAFPAEVDVYVTLTDAAPTAATKAISGLQYSASATSTSPFGFKFVSFTGTRDVVVTAKNSSTVLLRIPVNITKNYNHFVILSRRNGNAASYSYDYKYWNLP